ncbi:tRNA (guanine-N1)-methyltransferase [Aquimarina sp. W85]|uniref:tRNA (guanine-N1)-methyltransferase n=1 Tax=Aquimarina rhodophyticola TaxID=3342246 RepID=UPI003672DD0D
MTLPKYLLVLILSISFFQDSFAQEEQEDMSADQALKQANIEKQFSTVIKKSGRYQEYKVVKRVWIDQLKTNTLDTLKSLENRLTTSNQRISDQESKINELQQNLSATNQNLVSITEEKDTMNFLGVNMTKASYKTMMWAIVAVILALLGFFIFKFKNSNAVTLEAKKNLAETEAEFEDHRRRALEREQKVMRKLQDELNKQRKTGAN